MNAVSGKSYGLDEQEGAARVRAVEERLPWSAHLAQQVPHEHQGLPKKAAMANQVRGAAEAQEVNDGWRGRGIDIMSTPPDWSHYDFADQIKAENRGAVEAIARAIEHMMTAGDLLLKAESELMPWLKEHCELSDETTRLYMFMAQHRSMLDAKTQQTHSTIREAIGFLAHCSREAGDF